MLLDTKTQLPVKSQQLRDMEDWLSGTGKAHDSLVLEFRGTKPWTLVMPSVDCLKSVTAAIWEALDVDGRFLTNGALQRDSFEFGESLIYFLHLPLQLRLNTDLLENDSQASVLTKLCDTRQLGSH